MTAKGRKQLVRGCWFERRERERQSSVNSNNPGQHVPSQITDRAGWYVAKFAKTVVRHTRGMHWLKAGGLCYYNDDDVANGTLFCNTDCRDDCQKK